MELQWYFPDNGNGMEFGLETGDIDIFKKDPIGSLAREICQNSIDANRGTGATKIEFKPFKVKREDVEKTRKPLTIKMFAESAKAGKWLYD